MDGLSLWFFVCAYLLVIGWIIDHCLAESHYSGVLSRRDSRIRELIDRVDVLTSERMRFQDNIRTMNSDICNKGRQIMAWKRIYAEKSLDAQTAWSASEFIAEMADDVFDDLRRKNSELSGRIILQDVAQAKSLVKPKRKRPKK